MKRSLMLLASFLFLTAQTPSSDLASRELRLKIWRRQEPFIRLEKIGVAGDYRCFFSRWRNSAQARRGDDHRAARSQDASAGEAQGQGLGEAPFRGSRQVGRPEGPKAWCVEHVQQLGGESPLHSLMEAKC